MAMIALHATCVVTGFNYSKKHWASSQLIKVALGRLHKC